MVALCQTLLPPRRDNAGLHAATPRPIYGPGIYIYSVSTRAGAGVLFFTTFETWERPTGSERAELTFILIGALGAIGFAVALSFLLDRIIGTSRSLWFAPFRTVVFSLVVGYGIATRKILEVGYLYAPGDRIPPARRLLRSALTRLSGGFASPFSCHSSAQKVVRSRTSSRHSLWRSRWPRLVACRRRWLTASSSARVVSISKRR